jgi:outer membrane receptor protein involved in Fe transport
MTPLPYHTRGSGDFDYPLRWRIADDRFFAFTSIQIHGCFNFGVVSLTGHELQRKYPFRTHQYAHYGPGAVDPLSDSFSIAGNNNWPLPKWDFNISNNLEIDFYIKLGSNLEHWKYNLNLEGRQQWVKKQVYPTSCEEPFWIHRSGTDLFMVTQSGLLYRSQEYNGRWHMGEVLSKRPRIRVLLFDADTQTAFAFGSNYGIALTGAAEPFPCPDITTPGLHRDPLAVLRNGWKQIEARRRTLLLATLRWW